jgi:tetratricopeptide (TPR) repeat protein
MFRKISLVAALVAACWTSGTAQVNLEEGAALFEDGQYERAETYFTEAKEAHPDNPEVYYYLGRIAYEQDEWDDAVDFLNKAVKLNPESAVAHHWLGEAYIEKLQRASVFKKKGMATKAREQLVRAVELAPEYVEARETLIYYYLDAPGIVGGSKEKALENIEVMKTLDKRTAHFVMSHYHQKRKDLAAAEQELLAVVAMEPEDPNGYYRIGRMYQDGNEFDHATAAFERCLEIEPNYPNGLYQIGRSAVLSKRNIERGIECFKIYLTLKPGEDEPSLAWAHVRLGQLYERKREFVAAQKEYESALGLEPDHKEGKKALKRITRR